MLSGPSFFRWVMGDLVAHTLRELDAVGCGFQMDDETLQLMAGADDRWLFASSWSQFDRMVGVAVLPSRWFVDGFDSTIACGRKGAGNTRPRMQMLANVPANCESGARYPFERFGSLHPSGCRRDEEFRRTVQCVWMCFHSKNSLWKATVSQEDKTRALHEFGFPMPCLLFWVSALDTRCEVTSEQQRHESV